MLVQAYVVLAAGGRRHIGRVSCRTSPKATIALYKYPRRFEFLDALPRTSTGKLQRFRLRDPARSTRLLPVETPTAPDA